MNYWGVGLDTNSVTWLVYAGITLIWLVTLWIATPLRIEGWRAIPTTLFGWAWLGFGLHIVTRFLLLSLDSVDLGNGSFRLAYLPASTLNGCLMDAGLFWLCFGLGYCALRRADLPNPLLMLNHVATHRTFKNLSVIALTTMCIYLSLLPGTPTSLITPLALLGSLWVLPATFVWSDAFRASRPRKMAVTFPLLLVLLPGLVGAWLNPYREGLLLVLLVPFIAALFAGIRLKLSRVLLGGLVVLVICSALVQSYRKIVWFGQDIEEVQSEARFWTEVSPDAPWMELLRRFHALDSLLLTVNLIPTAIPYSGANFFSESIIRGLLPRVFDANKGIDNEGMTFGQTIWNYQDSSEGGAPIAPSAPGSLYAAGGSPFVALGAILWGVLIGICESWKRSLLPSAQAALLAMWVLGTAASIERGYSHNVSTLLQQIVVLSCVLAVVFVRSRKVKAGFGAHSVGNRINLFRGLGKNSS